MLKDHGGLPGRGGAWAESRRTCKESVGQREWERVPEREQTQCMLEYEQQKLQDTPNWKSAFKEQEAGGRIKGRNEAGESNKDQVVENKLWWAVQKSYGPGPQPSCLSLPSPHWSAQEHHLGPGSRKTALRHTESVALTVTFPYLPCFHITDAWPGFSCIWAICGELPAVVLLWLRSSSSEPLQSSFQPQDPPKRCPLMSPMTPMLLEHILVLSASNTMLTTPLSLIHIFTSPPGHPLLCSPPVLLDPHSTSFSGSFSYRTLKVVVP